MFAGIQERLINNEECCSTMLICMHEFDVASSDLDRCPII